MWNSVYPHLVFWSLLHPSGFELQWQKKLQWQNSHGKIYTSNPKSPWPHLHCSDWPLLPFSKSKRWSNFWLYSVLTNLFQIQGFCVLGAITYWVILRSNHRNLLVTWLSHLGPLVHLDPVDGVLPSLHIWGMTGGDICLLCNLKLLWLFNFIVAFQFCFCELPWMLFHEKIGCKYS